MAHLTFSEAADCIGVSQRQVRNLAAHGEIGLIARGVVDADSVSAFLRDRGQVTRRVWSEETAWAAIGALADEDISWLGASQASRLRKQMRGTGAAELASRIRNRATVHRFDGHRSVTSRVVEQLVSGAALIGDLTVEREVDGYLDEDRLADLVDRFRLRTTSNGTITIRATHHLAKAESIAARDAELLAAVDLATSVDAREREAALAVLTARVAAL
ncbi:MAG: hypothetical protein H7288_16250 [Kineosporiaceae bacterium]|nr:hypothetical protein [Aeromicrobium sp.]